MSTVEPLDHDPKFFTCRAGSVYSTDPIRVLYVDHAGYTNGSHPATYDLLVCGSSIYRKSENRQSRPQTRESRFCSSKCRKRLDDLSGGSLPLTRYSRTWLRFAWYQVNRTTVTLIATLGQIRPDRPLVCANHFFEYVVKKRGIIAILRRTRCWCMGEILRKRWSASA